MKLGEFKLLADENIHADVVQFLRDRSFDVRDVSDAGLYGTSDIDLIQYAVREVRVILTHDSDFGTLAVLAGEPIIGIVFVRPGHFDPSFTIDTIDAVLQEKLDLVPPFILVAQRNQSLVSIRLRAL